MSMISAQIDELRELAGDGSMEWVTGPIRASVLRDAADTIWQLRDDLQRANTENAKLREERDYHKALWEHVTVTDCELRRVRAAWKEDREKNAKLRELIADVHESLKADKAGMFHNLTLSAMEDDMRELGIEVDG